MKTNIRYWKTALLIILMMSLVRVQAQEPVNLVFLRSLPQSFKVNPATKVPYSWWMGVPGISGLHLGFDNSGFRYKDVIYRTPDDSLHVDVDGFLNSLSKTNYLSVEMQAELLAFGFHARKYYFDFRVSERSTTSFVYSKDLMGFLLKLNGQYINEEASFSGTGINSTLFHEVSFGIGRPVNDKWYVGARFKFLSGVYNIYTRKTDISLFTNEANAYELTLDSDIEINTSFPGLELDKTDSLSFPITNRKLKSDLMSVKNPGFAIDLGVNYTLNEKLNLGVSLTDFGFISWQNNTRSYKSGDTHKSFTFDGIDIADFFEDDSSGLSSQLNTVLDSLKNSLGLITDYGAYISPLLGRINFQAEYLLTEKDHFGGILRIEVFNKKARPMLALNYNHEFGRWLNVMAGYSITPGNYVNLGLGYSIKWGGVQLYMLTDNAWAFFDPTNFKSTNFQFGMNLCFGDRRFRL